ncbi:unnamed protein product [Diabrotica balteata]|uniref:dolichyl-phosphate-mannose--protein mannosyltransferase n=1 Tax=Diabrotica balteata TaxID=107213 RepID=A0A9N9T5Q1_DIABA|nr:unnamed protein product [Diabrotica balteata]
MLFLKDNMTQRNATGNIPPLNNQENLYDENSTPDTISESDYDRNHNSKLNSDPELNTEIIFTATPKAAKIANTDKETGTKGKKAKSSVYEKMVAIEEEKLRTLKEKCKERPKEERPTCSVCLAKNYCSGSRNRSKQVSSGNTIRFIRKRIGCPGWRYLLLSMISMATAMLCKEQGITVAGVCAAYEIFVAQKIRLPELKYMLKTAIISKSSYPWSGKATKRLAVLASTTLCLLLARLQIMGSQLPVFTRFDNPASVAVTPTRQLTYHYLISVNLWLLLFPCDLCCDWTMGTIPLVETFFDMRNLGTLTAYGFVAALLMKAFTTENKLQSTILLMSTSLMVFPFIPASNFFFPVGFVIAERVLYMPSMGFCMLVGYGFHVLSQKRHKKLFYFLMCLLLASHAGKTYLRNWDWENEYSIFMSGLRVNQRNAKLFNNVGHALESQGNFEDALKFFKTAVSVQEDDVGAHINVGRTYNHLKMFKEAEEAYLKAKSLLPKAKPGESYQARIAPNHLNVFLNLANLISKNSTRLEEADMLYRQAISMRADYTQAYINRGDILIRLNRTKEAQEVYERALLYDSNNPDIYYNVDSNKQLRHSTTDGTFKIASVPTHGHGTFKITVPPVAQPAIKTVT